MSVTYRRFALRTPTLNSELRRGLHPLNLLVALGTALAAAALVWLAGWERSAPIAALATFALVTLMHTALHAYFGWRIQRGIQALRHGDHARALRLLSVLRKPGMEHYDPRGTVRQVLDKLEPPA